MNKTILKERKKGTQNGITLIALIITIIVLLILAVVAIREITGDGIIKHAIQAREDYKVEQEKEEIRLALNEWKIVENTNPTKTFVEFMQEKFGADKVTANGTNEVIVTMESGNQYKVNTNGTITKLGEEVIPQLNEYGFYYGVPYMGAIGGQNGALVFYENGNFEMFGPISENSTELFNFGAEVTAANAHVDYALGKIKITIKTSDSSDATETMDFVISENGQEISATLDGESVSCKCNFTQELHGIYLGETYEGEYNSQKVSVVIHNDGTATIKEGESTGTEQGTLVNDWTWVNSQGNFFGIANIDGTKVYTKGVILTLKRNPTLEFSNNLIPEGGVYTIKSSGIELVGDGKTVYFPKTVVQGDRFIYNDYEYRYKDKKVAFFHIDMGWGWDIAAQGEYEIDTSELEKLDGWGVSVLDKTKTQYSDMLSIINGIDVKYADATFNGCENMIKTAKVSANLESMEAIFANCTTLSDISELNIPTKITKLLYTFAGCTSLVDVSGLQLHDKISFLSSTFEGCSSLVDASGIHLPNEITGLYHTFQNCTSLTKFPDLSTCTAASIRMIGTFSGCVGLTSLEGLVIPTGTTSLAGTFQNCTGLTTLDGLVIPSGVKTLGDDWYLGCFSGCSNLVDASSIIIPTNCQIYEIFQDCTSLTKIPRIPENVQQTGQAFQNTPLLKEIWFEGTKEKFTAFCNNESTNPYVEGKTIHCTDGDITY